MAGRPQEARSAARSPFSGRTNDAFDEKGCIVSRPEGKPAAQDHPFPGLTASEPVPEDARVSKFSERGLLDSGHHWLDDGSAAWSRSG